MRGLAVAILLLSIAPMASVDELAERLRAHVRGLAEEIGDRHLSRREALQYARDYVAAQLAPFADELIPQTFEVDGHTVANLIALSRGTDPSERLVVGAHYDTCFNPGADDNASGVAGLIELARAVQGRPHRRTIHFVAFVNEEPPYFQTPQMGSAVYVARARAEGARIAAVVILEMIGYYTNAANSQTYPPLFGLGRPTTGNYLGVVGNMRSYRLITQIARGLRRANRLPIQSIAAPARVPGVAWSDQWAFWRAGIRGVMLTDTAFYRNPHYHHATDTWDTLDYAVMASVVESLSPVVLELAGAAAP